VAKYADGLRAAAIAAVLAPFVLTFARNRRHAAVRANSVQLSRTQIPELYEDFEGCARRSACSLPRSCT
jgi:hypothetical protein